MPQAKTPEPLLLPFFTAGLFLNRSPLFNALSSVGIQFVTRHDALIDGVNIEVTDRLTLQRRPGFVKYCTQQLQAGEKVNQFYSVRNLSGTVTPMVDTNLALYTLTPTALTSILTKTTTGQAFVQQVGNITYISDGVDFYKWDGMTLTGWGTAAPSVAPVVSNGLTRPGYWIPGFAYSANTCLLDINGNIEFIKTTGRSGASVPQWTGIIGATTTDGTAVWTNVGPPSQWVASVGYLAPTVITDTNNNIQLVTAAGTSGSSAPSWNATLGGTTTDSGVTWTNIGPGTVQAYAGYSWVYAFRTMHGNLSTSSPASPSTGPILSSTTLAPVTITAWSVTSNVATFTAANSFSVGQYVTLNGFPVTTGFNGQQVQVLAAGLSGSQFEANFMLANSSATETGTGTPVLATLACRQSLDPDCNGTATITAIQLLSNVVTVFCSNSFTPGLGIGLSGITTATFLNGQTLYVLSATSTQFTAAFTHADYSSTPDTGTATFFAIEIYRTDDGGGIWYFDSAILNPSFSSPLGPYDSGLTICGAGADTGVPGTNTWTNPGNVTSASSYATSAFNPGSGSVAFSVIQSAKYGVNNSLFTGSISVTLPSAVNAANKLLVFCMGENVTSISDSQGNAYTNLVTGGSFNFFNAWIVNSPAAGSTRITVNCGSSDTLWHLFAIEISGAVSASPVDQTASSLTGASGSTFNTGSVTTLNATDGVITAAYASPGTGQVKPSGYTLIDSLISNPSGQNNVETAVAYEAFNSTSTYSPTWSHSGSVPHWYGCTIALKLNATALSDPLNATTFSIPVPAGVTPQGLTFSFDAKFDGGAGDGTMTAQILRNGVPYSNIKTITLTSSTVTYSLGGANDSWGVTFVPADITDDTNWGLQLVGIQAAEAGGPYTFSVRHVKGRVQGLYGIETASFYDTNTDAELDNELVAPLFHLNDPPPGATGSLSATGGTIIAYWMGRIWMLVGNNLYFSGGPDTLNGISEECFPPANVFTFPGAGTGLWPTTNGLVVGTTAEWYAILGGPQTVSFYPQRILTNFGSISPNAAHQDGDDIYIYTTQKQAFKISGGKEEIGWNVGPLLSKGQSTASATASAWAPGSTYLTMHRNGEDSGIYLSNAVESIARFSLNANNWSPIYQPLLTGSPSIGAINSVETSSGIFSLLAASNATGDYIYARSLTTFTDNGHAYDAKVIVGNIVVTQPGQPMVPLYFINLIGMNVGSIPTVAFMSNEIATTGGAAFTTLPLAQDDPAFLKTSKTLMAKRWPTQMNQIATPLLMKHLQVSVDFGNTDTVANEILTLGLRFDQEQMG